MDGPETKNKIPAAYLEFGNYNDATGGGWHWGFSLEAGHCDRSRAACIDTGVGLQLKGGGAQFKNNQSVQADGKIGTFLPTGVLRLGLLFNPTKSFSVGPIVRGGAAINMHGDPTVQSGEPATTSDIDSYGQAAVRFMVFTKSPRTSGLMLDVGATYYSGSELSQGSILPSLGYFFQISGPLMSFD